MEDVVESVARIFLGRSGPGGTYTEALQGWLLKYGEDRNKLRISVKTFAGWLANQNPPWETYWGFISGCLILIDKHLGFFLVGIRETRKRLFVKCELRVMLPEDTNVCQDDQICSELKEIIDEAVHGVQGIWYSNSSTEDWFFLLVDAKNPLNENNRIGILWAVLHLWPSRARSVF